MSGAFFQAIQQMVLTPEIWLIILLSATYGVFVGAIPGLTATMAVALFVPTTYWLDPIPALAAIVTMVACAIFAGDIPTTLLRIPGTPASAAYVDDAYTFTKQGQADRPLGTALLCSVLGGLFGAVVLMILGHQLARIAAMFSVAEYFWLYLLGLSSAVVVSRGSTTKAMLGLFIGLILATVGLSEVHTQARFTFGQPELFEGINFIPAMIGLFGLSEVLRNLISLRDSDAVGEGKSSGETRPRKSILHWIFVEPFVTILGPAVRLFLRRKRHWLRSGSIGAVIGMLPGAGADIGSWVSIAASKRYSEKPEKYGSGSLEGVADATTANNAALAGSWIPALVFGIPGDSITAIVIGVLLMKNVNPGPEIFEKQTALVYSIYLAFILANLILIPIGLMAIRAGRYVVRVPQRILLPVILLFCIIGSFAIKGSYFDVGIMLGMGILGYWLERREVPLGPVVLGIILGGPLEARFIQTMTGSGGSLLAFFNRPAAAILGVITIFLWVSTAVRNMMAGRQGGDVNNGPSQ
ncbi:MAG TPA: tripartite tricarboxylate transporter permease [bacterium]|nr:tripartite tricarboxylate transporter permease [bacterium]